MKTFIHLSGTLIIAAAFLCIGNKVYGFGANMPWTEYEAEDGTLGGGAAIVSLVQPLNNPSNNISVEEASGAAYVTLTNTGQSVSWVNNSGQSITALNIRYSIPDAPAGYGITNTIDLYVNGTFRQAIPVNSRQTWVYGNSTEKNPTNGSPYIVWDEYHCFLTGAAIASGSTITLQKDSSNTASFYNIDLIDLENPPAPLTQPAGSLSIISYGAVSNSPATDNTTAIQNCINAAQSSGQVVWIPAGEFFFGSSNHNGMSATGVTIEGAGMWYSELYNNPTTPGQGGGFFNNLVSCTLQNVDLDCNANDSDSPGAMDVSGTNWMVNAIWASHLGVGFWGAGNNGTVKNMRVNNAWGDGINLNNFTGVSDAESNVTISNNFVRFVNNDGIAINGTDSSGHTPMSGVNIISNTVVEAAGRLVVYGGNNIVIQGNYCHDLVQNDGIQVGYFQQSGSVTNVLVAGNEIVRCGDSTYQSPGLLVGDQFTTFVNNGTNESYIDANVTAIGNIISDPYYGGIQVQTCSNVDLENNVISAPQLYGIQVASFASGNAVINNNFVSSLPSGQATLVNDSTNFPLYSATAPIGVPTEAASYNSLSPGSMYLENCAEGGEDLCNIYNGNYAVYSNLDLNGINSFVARVASANAGGDIQIYLDSTNGTLLGTCAVPSTSGWQTWTTVAVNLSGATNYHNVYLVFNGGASGSALFNVEWFQLFGNANTTEAASYNAASGPSLQTCSEGGENLGNIYNGNYVVYSNLDLNDVSGFTTRVASANAGGDIQIRLDSTNGTLLGTCIVPSTGGWETWTTVSCGVNANQTGYHNVYLVFNGGASGTALFNMEWFYFNDGIINGTEAASYNSLSPGSMYLENCAEGGEDLCNIYNGNYAVYSNLDLNGINSFVARVASANAGGDIQIYLDSTNGTLLGTCAVPSTSGWQSWTTVTTNLSGATGYHNVYLVFNGGGSGTALFNVERFALLANGDKIEAASYNAWQPGTTYPMHLETCAEGGQDLCSIYNGDYTVYSNLDLTGTSNFVARVASANAGGDIQIYLDSTNGTLLGTCAVSSTSGWQSWTTVTANLSGATGYHNVYLLFNGGGSGTGLFNLQWFALQGGL
jgi:hypothetical protein